MSSKSLLVVSLLTVLFLFGVAQPSQGQGIGDRNRPSNGGSHNISGRVVLPNGRPAMGASVYVNGPDFTNANTVTDANGAFTIGSIPAGNYTITVRAKGFQSESESLTIERFAAPGQRYQMIFHLRTPPTGPPATAGIFDDVPKDAVAKFENGREKLAKGDAKGSISDFEAAITTYPKFAVAYYEKGGAYLKLNDSDKATAAFVKAIEIKPDYLEAKYGYGLAQFQKKEYVVAAAAFNDVLQQKRDILEARLNLGISLYHLQNVEAAEAELKLAAANGKGKLPLTHLYLGQIYAQKKKNAEAANELQKYVDLAPNAPNVERIRLAIADLKKQS